MTARSRWTRGALALTLGGAIVALAGFGSHHHGDFRERVDARVQKMLNAVKATPDQRQKVSGMEDLLLSDIQTVQQTRHDLIKELVDEFPREHLDTAALDRARDPAQTAQVKLHDDLRSSMIQLHDLLTPEQRQELTQRFQKHLEHWEK